MAVTSALAAGCGPSEQDATARRRTAARQTCEAAVSNQLASGATATFNASSEHVYYDSLGGAAVSGVVASAAGNRNFACILKPLGDSGWTLSAARLLN